jgi:hypothetical protein
MSVECLSIADALVVHLDLQSHDCGVADTSRLVHAIDVREDVVSVDVDVVCDERSIHRGVQSCQERATRARVKRVANDRRHALEWANGKCSSSKSRHRTRVERVLSGEYIVVVVDVDVDFVILGSVALVVADVVVVVAVVAYAEIVVVVVVVLEEIETSAVSCACHVSFERAMVTLQGSVPSKDLERPPSTSLPR